MNEIRIERRKGGAQIAMDYWKLLDRVDSLAAENRRLRKMEIEQRNSGRTMRMLDEAMRLALVEAKNVAVVGHNRLFVRELALKAKSKAEADLKHHIFDNKKLLLSFMHGSIQFIDACMIPGQHPVGEVLDWNFAQMIPFTSYDRTLIDHHAIEMHLSNALKEMHRYDKPITEEDDG